MSLIVEIEMPLNCERCPMSHWNKLNELTGCDAVDGNRYVSDDEKFWRMARPPWCPIKGVLPDEHGDLIDRDELLKERYPDDEFDAHVIYADDIHKAKAVIAAERKDDGK